jgi:outer membrane immunogenic protein
MGVTMKRIVFLAAVVGLGLTQGARAADMSVHGLSPSPFYMPPVNSMPDWSGLYIGFNGGYGFGSSSVSANFFGPVVAGFPAIGVAGEPLGFSTAGNPSGAVFGGQVGYNWQWASVVFGVEGDFGAATLTASGNALTNSIANPGFPVGFQASSSINWLTSVRARLGYTWGPGLVYVTGGGAWVNTDIKTLTCDTGVATCTVGNFTGTQSGWTFGAGYEWMIAPNWIGRAEYLYYSLGSRVNASAFGPDPLGLGLAGSGVSVTANTLSINVIRAGLEYKFDWH